MSSSQKFPLHKGEIAVVKRVVPGRLVYVAKKDATDEDIFGFKLNQLTIREPDGSWRPYRGEPLSDLGIKIGRQVNVGEVEEDGEPTLIIQVEPRVELTRGIATAISTAAAVANTIFDKARRR